MTSQMSNESREHWLARLLGTDFLLWSPNIQPEGFLHWDRIFATRPIRHSQPVFELPRAAKELDVRYEDQGQDCDVADLMRDEHLSGLIVLKNGEILIERYALGLTPELRWQSSSMVKSLTSTLIGAAVHDGLISSLDDEVTHFLPDFLGTGYEGVTVRHLLTMTSGIDWTEDYEDMNADVQKHYIKPIAARERGHIERHLKTLKRIYEPGTQYYYNSGDTFLLSLILSKVTGKTVADYCAEKIWASCGMEQDGYFMLDADGGQEITGSCCGASLRDYARFGLLMLNDGVSPAGNRILPQGWTQAATAPSAPNFHKDIGERPRLDTSAFSGYGHLWWVHHPGSFMALGAYGQWIHVEPKQGLVFVMVGAMPREAYMNPDEPAAQEIGSQHGGPRRFAYIAAIQRAIGL
jgi:CubicO group peptidase (beta-lactamase class C family)